MTSAPINIAVVGATGLVGETVRHILLERDFPLASLRLIAGPNSVGQRIAHAGDDIVIQALDRDSFRNVDFAFFCASSDVSRKHAATAVAAGAIVIDNSSAFRLDQNVPLVVPEVNGEALAEHHNLIANPNCSTILLTVALAPLHRRYGVRRVVVATYQAVSGVGRAGMSELREQQRLLLEDRPLHGRTFSHPIADNVFCHDSNIDENGNNVEELKLIHETRRLLTAPNLALAATCVRVPVPRCHCEAVHVELARNADPDEVRELLSRSPGVRIIDDRAAGRFPMPVLAEDGDDVLVGRIRRDDSIADGRGIAFFLSGDQVRKGAATNAVQIAEALVAHRRTQLGQPAPTTVNRP